MEGKGKLVFVLCDLEGVSGVVNFDADCAPGQPNYTRSLRLATEELNALIRGLRRGGAEEITVLDGHGPGGLDIELVKEEAEIYLGRPLSFPFGLDRGWDTVVLFAHHAMEGTPEANLRHSWSHKSIEECTLNGEPIGEIGWYVYLAGYFGVPVILITGDDKACAEAQRYVPNMEIAVVKKGCSVSMAICKSPHASRRIIEKAAERAMQRIEEIKPVIPSPPYRATRRYAEPKMAEGFCSSRPWAQRIDEKTVAVESDDYLDLSRRFL
jgi:D-amino peptidase